MEKQKLVLIDGNSLIYRAYHALPPMNNSKGTPTQAIYGFLNMLFKIVETQNPQKLVVAFDSKGPTPRHIEYNEYKAGRKETPDELKTQFPIIMDLLEKMNVATIKKSGLEADDFLGILSRVGEKENMQVVLVTGDRDALQLITDDTKVLLTKKGISETLLVGKQELFEQYGLAPEQMIELKGLMGDSSDNIPGIKGVGEKTALKLVLEYGTVENVIANAVNLKGKLREKVENDANQALMSKRIGTIILQSEGIDKSAIENAQIDPSVFINAKEMLFELELRAIINKINKYSEQKSQDEQFPAPCGFEKDVDEQYLQKKDQKIIVSQDEPIEIDTVEKFDELIKSLSCKTIAIFWEDEQLSIGFEKQLFIINIKQDLISQGIDFETARQKVGEIIQEESICKNLFNIKNWMHELPQYEFNNIGFDAFIAAYLLRPTTKQYKLDELCDEYIDQTQKDARSLFSLCEVLSVEIKKYDLEKVYSTIEKPLISVLYKMEKQGFSIDIKELEKLGAQFEEKITTLKAQIFEHSGHEFNILSPKQLGVVLFEELALPTHKKTKTGYSTDIETMEFLSDKHLIVDKVLEYRQITKLKSTYIDGLIAIEKKSKVHTSFNQTVTATGRISSTEPNLQNIPIRTPLGRQIRKAFIPTGNNILVGADYSQIELRVLAHFSGDENMINAFKTGEDIHTSTAAKVAACALSEVTSEMRSAAKAVNFGIVYGISDYGLSKQLGIGRKEAAEYIESYLIKYPGIKDYMDTMIALGKKNGYVETLFGRKRFLPEIFSKNYNIRSFGERVAMNAPIQGSAADIIKIAMIKVQDFLEKNNLKSKLILQVHDELIIDTDPHEKEIIEKNLKQIMENIVTLDAPIIADVGSGKNWYYTK